ncbi:hypothetical protein EJ05DRAFT_480472 [Pseudovirgaria hyperparasitica]|uniref:Ribosomal protein S15 n=1 Tax=Pseudovirgaria hyperparasitica TaxID=470096 RepID=A0A6A6VTI8_9PEZI|nr:uncharacterized protein EJ05DRAFT_480472 [Pseudovirgaria hyperparasitica]KAF2753465.1 hypothetical protein EJ05DRAFT_480472 [Pseudovirgaria hyperparasitica]
MLSRIPILNCLRAQVGGQASQNVALLRSFSSSPSVQASRKQKHKPRRSYRDLYAADYRKKANIARQEVLKKERSELAGDPVKGRPTPFLESLDTGKEPEVEVQDAPYFRQGARGDWQKKVYLSSYVREDELEEVLNKSPEKSHMLIRKLNEAWQDDNAGVKPVRGSFETDEAYEAEVRRRQELRAPLNRIHDEEARTLVKKRITKDHDTAKESLRRILQLENASHKDIFHSNVLRCIDKFGRHHTDKILKPPPNLKDQKAEPRPYARGGPDTGSSEVQIAILTAKIQRLSRIDQEGQLRKDKANKRNLTLLVHRRQKLMKYLYRKEKGGPRWQHLVDTLGLGDAMWKGEISL